MCGGIFCSVLFYLLIFGPGPVVFCLFVERERDRESVREREGEGGREGERERERNKNEK